MRDRVGNRDSIRPTLTLTLSLALTLSLSLTLILTLTLTHTHTHTHTLSLPLTLSLAPSHSQLVRSPTRRPKKKRSLYWDENVEERLTKLGFHGEDPYELLGLGAHRWRAR